MDQPAPAHGCGKQKRHLGLGEGECGALMRNDPRQENDDEQDERAEGFVENRVGRETRRGTRSGCAPASAPAKQDATKVPVEVKAANDCPEEILGLLETLEPHGEAV